MTMAVDNRRQTSVARDEPEGSWLAIRARDDGETNLWRGGKGVG